MVQLNLTNFITIGLIAFVFAYVLNKGFNMVNKRGG